MKKNGLFALASSLLLLTSNIIAQVNDTFNIIYYHDFNQNTLGIYDNQEWLEDFWYPSWSDRQVPPVIIEDPDDAVNNSKMMQWNFPEGTYGPRNGGGQWEVKLPTPLEEVYLSYNIMFKPGFDFVIGGKIPGLKGGPKTSGEPPEWDEGFTASLMWHIDGKVVTYSYHHDQIGKYGDSFGWEDYIQPGKWHNITIRCVMNSIGEVEGNNDGIIEGYFDGRLSLRKSNMRFRNISDIGIDALKIYSHFGGGSDDWACTRDEWVRLDDIVCFTYKDNIDVPRGRQTSSWDRELILPKSIESPMIGEDTPSIRVSAYGTQYNNEYAHFKVLVNKEYIGETYVTGNNKTYTFPLTENINDNDTVYIVFDNDLYIKDVADINLYINSIEVNNKTYYPDNYNVVFVYDRDVLEGNDIKYGSSYMGYGGKLVFFLGGDVILDDVYPTMIAKDIFFNEPPVIEEQSFTISDDIENGELIGKILASDAPGQKITYTVTSQNLIDILNIDPTTGNIVVTDNSQLSSINNLIFIAKATDNQCNNLCDSALVTINITHLSEPIESNNAPTIENQSFSIEDNLTQGKLVGDIIASNPDETQQLIFKIINGNTDSTFSLSPITGKLYINNNVGLIADKTFNLLVKVEDNGIGNLSDTAIISITINETELVADNYPPVITDQEFDINEQDETEDLEFQIIASDINPEQYLTYSIVSGNESGLFNLDPTTGKLTVNDLTNVNFKSTSSIILLVKVTDNGEVSLSSTANVKINIHEKLNIFYIDPSQKEEDPMENGSIEHPFNSWSDVTWEEGCSYLQKRGTTANEAKINLYANNIILGAYGEGERPIINSTSKDFAIRAYEKSNIYIQYLKILANEAISCIYFMGITSDNNVVENCHIEGALFGIRIIDGKKITLKYNTFKQNGDGIYSLAETTEVFYNIFNGNSIAINISSLLSSAVIFNNVFYDNIQGVSTSYASLVLYNNIFYLVNSTDKAINHKIDDLVSDNNIFYPEQEGFLDINNQQYSTLSDYQEDLELDLHSFISDPMFVNEYNENFNLSAGSPGINAGKYVGMPMDLYGYEIPYGEIPDIGVIESIYEDAGVMSSVLDNNQDDNTLMVYPNPSRGIFKVSFLDTKFQAIDLQVVDLNGAIVYQNNMVFTGLDLETQIDIAGTRAGIYIIFLTYNNKTYSQQLIIM